MRRAQAARLYIPKNSRKIITENDASKVRTVDETGNVEDFIVLSHARLFFVGWWVLPVLLLVDFEKLLSDKVVVPAEEDEERTTDRWEENEPILGEDVVPEFSGAILPTKLELCLERVAIEWREIDIGRGIVDRPVLVIRAEARVNHKCGKSEEKRRVSGRVGLEMISPEECIEDEARVGLLA